MKISTGEAGAAWV
jgi:hypothetical protein